MAGSDELAAELRDLRACGWIVQPDLVAAGVEGYYASVSTLARGQLPCDCLAALGRCGVPVRCLSLLREGGRSGGRRVAVVTGQCAREGVIAALTEVAADRGELFVVPIRRHRKHL